MKYLLGEENKHLAKHQAMLIYIIYELTVQPCKSDNTYSFASRYLERNLFSLSCDEHLSWNWLSHCVPINFRVFILQHSCTKWNICCFVLTLIDIDWRKFSLWKMCKNVCYQYYMHTCDVNCIVLNFWNQMLIEYQNSSGFNTILHINYEANLGKKSIIVIYFWSPATIYQGIQCTVSSVELR